MIFPEIVNQNMLSFYDRIWIIAFTKQDWVSDIGEITQEHIADHGVPNAENWDYISFWWKLKAESSYRVLL